MVKSFSVIVPAYNCEKVVGKTIESIIESIDYFYANCDRRWSVKAEIIVVNDCSTDNTLYFLSQFVGKKYPFKIINHPQGRGAGSARNTGVKNSQGEILFFCDGDDLYLPEHIYVCFMSLNYDPLSSNSEGSFALGDLTIELKSRLDAIRTGVKIKDKIDPNWKQAIENTLTINLCLRRECHEFIEGYPEDLVYRQIRGREDCAYQSYLSNLFNVGKIPIETVEYVRYPGNSLDIQIKRLESGQGMPEEEKVLHDRAKKLEEEKITYLIEKYNKLYPQGRSKSEWKEKYKAHCQSKGYQFTQDWFSINIPLWQQVLQQYANRPGLNFLEIGSWEGRSTCWLLDRILTHESSRITCIDTFEGSAEHQGYESGYIKSIEEKFDYNITRAGGAERVEKLIGISQKVLRQLPMDSYDVIYIDGSHLATDVLEDTLLSWRLAKIKGLIIFDDYNLTLFKNPTQNAKLGVDAFLTVFHEKVKVLHKGYQVVVQKIAS